MTAGGVHLRPLWQWHKGEQELFKQLVIGRCLHVFSGHSSIGDVRIDLASDEATHRFDALNFKDWQSLGEFDTVIADPPYKYYGRLKWILKLSDIARKRLILITPNVRIRLKGWELTPYLIDGKGIMVKLCLVYDRM